MPSRADRPQSCKPDRPRHTCPSQMDHSRPEEHGPPISNFTAPAALRHMVLQLSCSSATA
ncbi:hypothetical protein DPMN_013924 [Dreissena polymorpha]|uniref:Uncharacterized protein n=1 Tax=Dreissena polymorpha TaxID=45954 RepID=A0A9D4S286_DREPO|nr:hypothetical protein DPMN_013924 [Dreissena polymorpha]